MMSYLIYVRKSLESEDRQILSIESQIRELKELAAKRGLVVSEILSESQSAKKPGRPVFNDMMSRVYKGEAKGIICWKLDRLARNPVDGGSVIWAMKQNGLNIVTPTQTYSFQEDNLILMYIEFGMAQKYIDDLSKNVKRGLKAKIEKGWRPGVAPHGYLNEKFAEQGERKIFKDPERFPLIRKMWDLMLTGAYTPLQIVEIANTQWGFRTKKSKRAGGTPLSRSGIYRIFSNPFYCGLFEYNGELTKGKHEPMITIDEFDMVQELLGKKGRLKPQTHFFSFTGMIRCGECGGSITAEEKHQIICPVCKYKFSRLNKDFCPKCEIPIAKMNNPKLLDYTYYRCSKMKTGKKCLQPSITKEEMENQILQYLSNIEISEWFKHWSIEYLQETNSKEINNRTGIYNSLQKAYDQTQKQIDNLLSLKLNDLITDDEFSGKKSALIKEQSRLKEKLEDMEYGAEKGMESSEKIFTFSCHARKWFKEGSLEDKKEILATIGSNLTLKDKKLSIEPRKCYLIIEKGLNTAPSLKAVFEPKNNRFNSNHINWFQHLFPIMRGIVDDVRTYSITSEKYDKLPDLEETKTEKEGNAE